MLLTVIDFQTVLNGWPYKLNSMEFQLNQYMYSLHIIGIMNLEAHKSMYCPDHLEISAFQNVYILNTR